MAERLLGTLNERLPSTSAGKDPVPLESILTTEELRRRPSRPPDHEIENQALTGLVKALADSPSTILQTLADTILNVFQCDSAGMSLLTEDQKYFRWAAIAGAWGPHLGGGTPRDFGPCGDVLDRNAPLLFKHWERRYPYLIEATPLAEEGLLVPFYVSGKAIGTIWAITHDDRRQFDAEDLRQLESLSRFASAAYLASTTVELKDQRRAALDLMEDAILSRRKVEALNVELRDSEKRLHDMIDALPVAVYTTDAEGRITHFNTAAVALTGRTPRLGEDEWCITWKLFRLDGTPLPHSECPMAVALKEDRDVPSEQLIAERPDGTRRWVEVFPTRLRDREGRTTGGVNMIVDITERKQTEAALIRSEKLAAAGRLAAGLAHEINNPLQATSNLMELLRRSTKIDAEDRVYAEMAADELRRVTHLTRQSLSFYRETDSPIAIDLEDVIAGILSLYAKQIAAEKITVSTRFPAGGARIDSYPGAIRQVLSTLLHNALEAVRENGAIAIRVRKCFPSGRGASAHSGIRITMADNGAGIAPGNLPRIFEPFFTTKGERGTGLGLWVAQGIVSGLGGAIRVRSRVRPGKSGTCFSIFLPNEGPKKV